VINKKIEKQAFWLKSPSHVTFTNVQLSFVALHSSEMALTTQCASFLNEELTQTYKKFVAVAPSDRA
jgi:hypothetical protein